MELPPGRAENTPALMYLARPHAVSLWHEGGDPGHKQKASAVRSAIIATPALLL